MYRTTRRKKINKLTQSFFISIGVLFVCMSLGYQYLMLPSNIEKIVIWTFATYTKGEIELKVKRASLFYGFRIEDCKLRVKKTKEEVFSFDKGQFTTFLPALLAGELSIRNLAFDGGSFHLQKKKGRWNWGLIFAANDFKETEDDKQGDIPQAIPLFVPVRIHAKVNLHNFSFFMAMDDEPLLAKGQQKSIGLKKKVSARSKGELFSLLIENMDLQVALISRTFTEIPLSFEMQELFDTLVVVLKLQQPLTLKLPGGLLKGQPNLQLFVFHERKAGKVEFHSRMHLDTHQLSFVTKGTKKSKALDFLISYDVVYDTLANRLVMRHFDFSYGKKEPWIALQFVVNHVTEKNRSLHVKLKDSRIDLRELSGFLTAFSPNTYTSDPLRGIVELVSLSAFGGLDNLRLNGKVKATGLYLGLVKQPHKIDRLNMDVEAQVDLEQFIPLQDKQKGYVRSRPLSFSIFHKLNMPSLELSHQKVYVQAKAEVSPQTGVDVQMKIRDCDLSFFSDNYLQGLATATLALHSSVGNLEKIKYDLDLAIRDVNYLIKRSRAQPVHLQLRSSGTMDFLRSFGIHVHSLAVQGQNMDGKELLQLKTKGNVFFSEQEQSYVLKDASLLLNADDMYLTLPKFLQDSLELYQSFMANHDGKTMNLQVPLFIFKKNEASIIVRTDGYLEMPVLPLGKLGFVVDLKSQQKKISVNQFKLRGLRGTLEGDLKAMGVKKPKGWQVHADGGLRIFSDTFVKVSKSLALQGGLKLNIKVRPQQIDGYVGIQNLDLEFLSGNCNSLDKSKCKSFFIDDLTLDRTPIHHLLQDYRPINQQDRFLQKRYQQSSPDKLPKYNLRIGRITSSHNLRGEYNQEKNQRWHYIGHPQGKPGLRAMVSYNHNSLNIPRLDINQFHFVSKGKKKFWQQNGILRAKNIYIDFGDFNSSKMLAGLQLKVQDLDLEPYFPRANSNYDGIISVNVNVQFYGLDDDLLQKARGVLAVHRISPAFGGFISRILIPTQVVSLLVRNTVEIPAIKVKLQDGLLYSYIQVQRRHFFPGVFFSLVDKEIKQERVPLAQFLKRAQRQAQTFGK